MSTVLVQEAEVAPVTQAPSDSSRAPDLLTRCALVTLGLVAILALVQPLLPLAGQNQIGFGPRLAAPTSGWRLLGTDQLGRSMIPQLLLGLRITLEIAVPTAAVASLLASLCACLAAYRGGWVDTLASRIVDLLFTFPAILLALLLVSVIGPGTTGAIASIALIVSPQVFRVIRTRAREIAPREFVRSARVSGAGPWRVVSVHIFPNVAGTVIVQTTFAIVVAMLVESSLSFLGLGVTPPEVSLGSLVHDGYEYLTSQPWLVFEPAALLAIVIFALNIVGDWLRDRLEVREVADIA